MTKDDFDLARAEFFRDRDHWTNLVVQRRFWYQDLSIKITDRELSFISSLTPLSIGSIALISFNSSLFSWLALFLFAYSTVFSWIFTFSLNMYDRKTLHEEESTELETYEMFQKAATANFTKAINKTLTLPDVKSYYELKNVIPEGPPETKLRKFVRFSFQTIYFVSIFSFFLGLISLLSNLALHHLTN